jgi:hypothetical protein
MGGTTKSPLTQRTTTLARNPSDPLSTPPQTQPAHLGLHRDAVWTGSGRGFSPTCESTFLTQLKKGEHLMPRSNGTTDAQTSFLSAFRKSPFGPPPNPDPPLPSSDAGSAGPPSAKPSSPCATPSASSPISSSPPPPPTPPNPSSSQILNLKSQIPRSPNPSPEPSISPTDAFKLLRLAHLRSREQTPTPLPPGTQSTLAYFRKCGGDMRLKYALQKFDRDHHFDSAILEENPIDQS